MKKIIILLGCLILWCCGCMMTPVSPSLEFGKNYKLGKLCTVDTGSIMIQIFNAYVFPEYKPKYNYQPPQIKTPFPMVMPKITPRQKWHAIYNYKNDYIIFCDTYSPTYGIRIKPNGELTDKETWVHIYQGSTTFSSVAPLWKLTDTQLFEPTEGYIIEAYFNSFKAELIYTGKMGDIITISYREYSDNMARPAFYQELKYDLNKGNDIAFKSLKIKILEATNLKISFQVIDDGDLPWVPINWNPTREN